MEAGPDEAGQGNNEDDEADDEQGSLEEALAGGGAPGHPEAASDDGDGGQEGEEIQEADHRIAESVHLSVCACVKVSFVLRMASMVWLFFVYGTNESFKNSSK